MKAPCERCEVRRQDLSGRSVALLLCSPHDRLVATQLRGQDLTPNRFDPKSLLPCSRHDRLVAAQLRGQDLTPNPVRLPIESVAHAAQQVLRLGVQAEVLRPAALRREVGERAKAIAALYRR
jgi:hypothetical protein